MPTETRSQGRPARGDGEVGRLRLLERTREALKAKPRIDLQRREIALAAGVTPALVSYYYPDKWDLLAAAAKPVIESYTAEVRAILASEGGPHRKVLALTYLFVDFNFQHGYLLDFYLENNARMARQDDMRHLQEVYEEMTAFFGELLRDGLMRGDNPAFVQASLWGLCKYVAQQPSLAGLAESPDKDEVLRRQAEKVCDLFLHGAAMPGLVALRGAPERATAAPALV